MNKSSTHTFSKNQLRLAEEHYKRGNLKGATEIVQSLTFDHPNSSWNHQKFSQVLVAYKIHRRKLYKRSTHYEVLLISRPLCSQEMIERKYWDLMDKLCPDENVSVAAKSALEIIKTAWDVLSDPKTRRDYNIKKGIEKRTFHRPKHQKVRDGDSQCVDIIIDDSDSD